MVETTPECTSSKSRSENEIWYCREFWNGDSRDGLYINGDGYHYFEMKGQGNILKAYEYYENDEGEEHVSSVSELIGLNWYSFFGFEDDEVLDLVSEQEFNYIESLLK